MHIVVWTGMEMKHDVLLNHSLCFIHKGQYREIGEI